MGHRGNRDTHVLLIDAFLQNNRLDHVTQVMGYHPKYLDVFMRTQNFILRGDGPLPYDYRHYIAIMAAGRHQCSYLIQLQRQEFIMQGGDKAWLKGLAYIPQKLRNLYDINKILAHRPWLLNKSHIQKLTKGSDNWSLAEVVHAIVLLVHFHCLCSFVCGCGVSEELDHTSERTPEAAVSHAESSELDTGVGVETLMQRMKTLSEKTEEFSAEERAKRFERVELQSIELGTSAGLRVKPSIGHFVDDPDFTYEDFARRGEVSTIPTFRIQDYSWDDQGYSLVNRLYNDVGNLLDDKFKTAYNLTYYTMGGRKDVDTSRFRRAIWNYIQCMFGIRHDDYDYGEVNQLLERSLKSFIKSTCCFPERTTKADYDRVLREFKHSEKSIREYHAYDAGHAVGKSWDKFETLKFLSGTWNRTYYTFSGHEDGKHVTKFRSEWAKDFNLMTYKESAGNYCKTCVLFTSPKVAWIRQVHVNIMVLEARMQAELLYALRAVMRYMT